MKQRVVETEFAWDRAEFARISQLMLWRRMRSPAWAALLLFGGGGILWFIARYAYYGWLDRDPWYLIGAAPWILFLLLWAWFLSRGAGWLAARRVAKLEPRTERLQQHRIDDSGVFIDSGIGDSTLPWSGVASVLETDEHFLWFWNSAAAHYTPKRALAPDQIALVRALITDNAGAVAEIW